LSEPHRAALIKKNNDCIALGVSSLTAADDISILSTLPDLRSRFLQDAVGDDIPSGLLSNHPALRPILETDSSAVPALQSRFLQADDVPLHLLSSVPVLPPRFLQHAVADDIPMGLLSSQPALGPILETDSSAVPALPSSFLQEAASDDTPSSLLSNISVLRSRFLNDAVGDDIPSGLLSNLPTLPANLDQQIGDELPLGFLSKIPAADNPMLVNIPVSPSGILSPLPALVDDDISTTVPGDSSDIPMMSKFPDPLGLLLNIPALRGTSFRMHPALPTILATDEEYILPTTSTLPTPAPLSLLSSIPTLRFRFEIIDQLLLTNFPVFHSADLIKPEKNDYLLILHAHQFLQLPSPALPTRLCRLRSSIHQAVLLVLSILGPYL
jgi:hypothetical protein